MRPRSARGGGDINPIQTAITIGRVTAGQRKGLLVLPRQSRLGCGSRFACVCLNKGLIQCAHSGVDFRGVRCQGRLCRWKVCNNESELDRWWDKVPRRAEQSDSPHWVRSSADNHRSAADTSCSVHNWLGAPREPDPLHWAANCCVPEPWRLVVRSQQRIRVLRAAPLRPHCSVHSRLPPETTSGPRELLSESTVLRPQGAFPRPFPREGEQHWVRWVVQPGQGEVLELRDSPPPRVALVSE